MAPEGGGSPQLLYEGKSKRLVLLDQDKAVMEFKDDVTAYDGRYRDEVPGKGRLSALLSARLFEVLDESGVETHYLCYEGGNRIRVRLLNVLPLEIIVRNYVYGSMARRMPLAEPLRPIEPALVELHYKDDKLGDPLLHPRDPIVAGLLSEEELGELEDLALRVNKVLSAFWSERGLLLVDLKLEVARGPEGFIVVDELSGDTMRLLDGQGRHLDKEIYRRSRDTAALAAAYARLVELAGQPARRC
ncbi:MAG: phosphoribosylaminoimidazolesuccinocarboxamide synthase [Thermoproteota archaeon]